MTNFFIAYPDIPISSTPYTINVTSAVGQGTADLITGPRNRGFEMQSAMAGAAMWEWDCGATTKSANFFSIQRAKQLTKAGTTTVNVLGSDYDRKQPDSTLSTALKVWFKADEGVTVDSVNRTSSWADTYHSRTITQSADANKPVWTRCDNKENLYKYSEDWSQSDWAKSRCSISSNAIANPLTRAVTADKLIEDSSAATTHHVALSSTYGAIAGVQYKWSLYAKADTRTELEMRAMSAYSTNATAQFNLSTGVVTATSNCTATIEAMSASGWYRCNMTMTATTTGGSDLDIFLMSAGSASYTGDGTSGLYIYGSHFRRADASDTYIKSESLPVIKGVYGRPSLWFFSSYYFGATNYAVNPTGGFFGFAVVRPARVTTVQRILNARDGTANSRFNLYIDASNRIVCEVMNGETNYIGRRTSGGELSVGTVGVITFTYDGTTSATGIKIYVDGTQVDTTTLSGGAYTVPTAGTNLDICGNYSSQYYYGHLCEAGFGEGVISDANRIQVQNYLLQKYKTATDLIQNTALDAATLYGPRSEDYYGTLSTGNSRRYWHVMLGSDKTTNKLRHSKQFLGNLFDFGREPHYSVVTKAESDGANNRNPAHIFQLEWRGIAWSTWTSFLSLIGSKKDTHSFVLYEASDNLLHGWKIVHVRLKDFSCTPKNVLCVDLRCEFEELI